MTRSTHNDPSLAQQDHPFYEGVDELLVTDGLQIVDRISCERILLPRDERWPSHHVQGHIGQQRDGSLHAVVSGGNACMYWQSHDSGITWEGAQIDTPGAGGFTVLDDDGFLLACGGGDGPIRILHSHDGVGWSNRGQIRSGLFDAHHIDSNLLQLRDGTVRLAVNLRLNPPQGAPLLAGQYPQYLLRSMDRGVTWSSYGAANFWAAVKSGEQSVQDDGPDYVWPGSGGTFPGVYETGFIERGDGQMMGAFRFSGPPRSWHQDRVASWGEPPHPEPDSHGRLFRHVVLGESDDGGRHWRNLRPILAADGTPLMAHGESNGELVELSDGRLVLIHQTRYAESFDAAKGYFRGRSTLSARVSDDAGLTWRRQRYRLMFGFGYSGTLVLTDDTLVTVTGCCLGDNGDVRRAAIIRWRID